MNYYEDPTSTSKPPVVESSPYKKVHLEGNNYVNVKPNGNNPNINQSANE